MVGRCNGPKKVARRRSKNAVSCAEYPLDKYPKYLNGNPGYVISTDVIPKLYNVSRFYPFISVEDVVFTGILPNRLGISRYCDFTMRPISGSKYKMEKLDPRLKFLQSGNSEQTRLIWKQFLTL